ncbi:hypothetical protein [Thermocatellispora tengchongensis]|uniref:hypothetical protein n=1 Tax=Thermocatellispora tengchongensis TaxID=1073253 RepID=UPI00363A325E
MSSVQKCSRCNRHASRNICRHSASGHTDTFTRDRSIHPSARVVPSPSGASSPALITRSRPPER